MINESYKYIQDKLKDNKFVILDGANGSELEKRGAVMDPICWTGLSGYTNPEILESVHEKYILAGSNIITTNTFSSSRINNWNDVQSSKLEFFKEFHFNMLKNGIYLPPSPFESYFISTSHSKENIEKCSLAIKKSLKQSSELEE